MNISLVFLLVLSIGSTIIAAAAFLISLKTKNSSITIKDDTNNKSLITKLDNETKQIEQKLELLNRRLQEISVDISKKIGRIKLYHYDAYRDTGGKMSFVLVLLDGQKNGVIINSMYGRENTRLYAKSVKNGKAETILSTEEENALNDVLKDSLKEV
jgi:hypothetical protein